MWYLGKYFIVKKYLKQKYKYCVVPRVSKTKLSPKSVFVRGSANQAGRRHPQIRAQKYQPANRMAPGITILWYIVCNHKIFFFRCLNSTRSETNLLKKGEVFVCSPDHDVFFFRDLSRNISDRPFRLFDFKNTLHSKPKNIYRKSSTKSKVISQRILNYSTLNL